MKSIKKTPYYSYCIGSLPKGCKMCVQGRKLVLFITGICSNNCFYCPISEKKKNKDVIYANETPISSVEGAIEEARLCSAWGAGITGGDPLCRLSRTVEYIRGLKKEFGKDFHIHLYTPLTIVSQDTVKKLEDAGLDELRFHPDLDKKNQWEKLELARGNMDFGIEIPVIPGRGDRIIELLNYVKDTKIRFVNLNELEYSDTNSDGMEEFETKNSLSYGISGSEELAMKILQYGLNTRYRFHYCTTTLKDRVQMENRIKLRAKNVKLPFEKVDEEGMLQRYAVYPEEAKPGFASVDRSGHLPKIEGLYEELKNKYGNKVFLDRKNVRVLTTDKILKRIQKDGFVKAKVLEYPTYDSFIVELEFI